MDPLVPPAFADLVAGRPAEPDVTGDDWLRRLPGLLVGALDRWDLRVDGDTRFGLNAVVVPVRLPDGGAAALKVTWPHTEARHEHLALRAWAGAGAVRLLAADPATWTLLLERLDPDRPLRDEPIDVSCEVIGALLRVLDRPALPQLDTLTGWLDGLTDELTPPAPPGHPALPRRFLDQARSLARDLRGEPGLDDRLVHVDLHDENVLHGLGPDAGWRAIDPKPLAAHPAFAVWPMLHNRWDELADDPRWGVWCRLGWICDAAGLDEDAARAWALLRTVADASWTARDDPGSDLTRHVTLLKALQPGA